MNMQMIVLILESMKVARFEKDVKDCILRTRLGFVEYQDYRFGVYLLRDAVSQHICLEYTLPEVKNLEDSIESINERIMEGKYITTDDGLVLQSFFPLIEGPFIEVQIWHSIRVIEKMIHMCKYSQ